MNIHEAVLQPIAAFVYCNRHVAAGRCGQTKLHKSRKFPRASIPIRPLRN